VLPRIWWVVRSAVVILLLIYCWVHQWQNFENCENLAKSQARRISVSCAVCTWTPSCYQQICNWCIPILTCWHHQQMPTACMKVFLHILFVVAGAYSQQFCEFSTWPMWISFCHWIKKCWYYYTTTFQQLFYQRSLHGSLLHFKSSRARRFWIQVFHKALYIQQCL